jgi:hypothetical protein
MRNYQEASPDFSELTGNVYRCLQFISLCVCLFAMLVPARANNDAIKDFLAANGCVFGPSTLELAVRRKINQQAFETYMKSISSHPGIVKTGEWLTLPDEICTLLPPMIVSEVKMTDPGVMESFSAIDAYVKDGDYGCFLDPEKWENTIQKSRNWTVGKTQQEYIRFLGASIIAGDVSFYSPDPLRTPPGLIATTGACANTPEMPEIKRNHGLLIKHFGAMLRADVAGEATCELGGAPSWKLQEIIEKLTGGQASNAWMSAEVRFITYGAGWYNDMNSGRAPNQPRPPLCRDKAQAK